MGTTLDGRLMQGAAQMLTEGKAVWVRYVGPGEHRDCWILLASADPSEIAAVAQAECVRLAAKVGRETRERMIPFAHVEVPQETLVKLEEALRRLEMQRFIATAKRRRATSRDALGRFQDCFHRSDPAGCR